MTTLITVTEPKGHDFLRLFPAILDALPTRATKYAWYLLWFSAEGDMPALVGSDMADVVATIEREGAFRLSWSQLAMLARELTQIFDLLVVGTASTATLTFGNANNQTVEQLVTQHELVVEAFDSYEWRVGGLDTEAVDAVAVALDVVRRE